MSMLSEFLAKTKVIEIEGKKIEIYPLKVKDMDLFSKENASIEEKMQMSKKIIKLSLEKSIPGITEEEINNLDIDNFTKIMDAINEVNGFTNERTRTIKEKTV